MQPQPALFPAGPGTLLDAAAILNGTVDMRTYQRKYLVVYAATSGGFTTPAELAHPDHQGILALVTTCVEWLDEHFGWELVNVFTREVNVFTRQIGGWHCCYAMLRRSRSE
ncbi:hypothetical protein AB0L63_17255 [Nocardia sp. NPDC051990]|uniref:hypothetical protein n=1 Tax=Nocardia sp. NPDC051990 TaxID=3155285 RepID=UPI0034156D83